MFMDVEFCVASVGKLVRIPVFFLMRQNEDCDASE